MAKFAVMAAIVRIKATAGGERASPRGRPAEPNARAANVSITLRVM
ncbi:MAG: hypothetical protein ACO1RT_01260 [Planctomycetaceae bacterium]